MDFGNITHQVTEFGDFRTVGGALEHAVIAITC